MSPSRPNSSSLPAVSTDQCGPYYKRRKLAHCSARDRFSTMLLDLPPEVIQTILWQMDPGTLLVCLSVCKRLFNIANSKHVLLRHLRSLPGITLGLEHLSTYDAFLLYRQRAVHNLSGAGVLAQLTRYTTGQDTINVRQCIFCPGSPVLLATVHRHQSIIRVFSLTAEGVSLRARLQPSLHQGDTEDGDTVLLKVAFSRVQSVAGLYKYTPNVGNGGPFVADAIARSKTTLKLVLFYSTLTLTDGTPQNPWCRPSETSDIVLDGDFEPAALAVANDGTACIAWSRTGHRVANKISIYKRHKTLMTTCGYDPSPRELTLDDRDDIYQSIPHSICSIEYTYDDTQLNIYTPGIPIHWLFSNFTAPAGMPFSSLNHNERLMCRDVIRVSTPFWYDHEEYISLETEELSCRMVFLAVALTSRGPHNKAFVVQDVIEERATHCKHRPELVQDTGHSDWTTLATLEGFTPGHSSLGVMSISPKGTRIAFSDWSQLRVWALDPEELQEYGLNSYFLIDEEGRLVCLRHVELRPQGVIHSMCWQDEDRLYAITDRGLARWDLGHMALGKEPLSVGLEA